MQGEIESDENIRDHMAQRRKQLALETQVSQLYADLYNKCLGVEDKSLAEDLACYHMGINQLYTARMLEIKDRLETAHGEKNEAAKLPVPPPAEPVVEPPVKSPPIEENSPVYITEARLHDILREYRELMQVTLTKIEQCRQNIILISNHQPIQFS